MILFSGQIDFFDPEIYDGDSLFMGTGAVIFVIDAQDDYVEMEAIQKLTLTVTRCGHRLILIFLPFLIKSLVCLKAKSMTPHWEQHYFSFVLSNNLISNPREALLSWLGAFQESYILPCTSLLEIQRLKDTIRCATLGA